MKLWLQPRILTNYLERSLNNGHYKLTYAQIATGLWRIKGLTPRHLAAIRRAWPRSEKQLRRLGTCAILVTQTYFESFPRREPRAPEVIRECIAYHWRKAAGVRLLTAKGCRNDPMALIYFSMRGANVHGTVAAVEDRVAVEWAKGHLTKAAARRLIDKVTEPTLPEHQLEFGKLMGIPPKELNG
jgi:hypothetical protein